jgi:hypothetical protein
VTDERDELKNEMGRGDSVENAEGACRGYAASLESSLDGVTDPEVAEHLSHCNGCRAALESARHAGAWLRAAQMPAAGPDSLFVGRVMSRIRSEQEERSKAGAFWVPVQSFASRMALASGMLLLMLSVYVYKSAPRQSASPQGARAEASADFPQPPAQPADKDEVLASLSGSQNGN